MPCTRWHYDDIYARIERQNEEEDPGDRFIITKLPAEDEDGRPTCPMILDARGIKQKRAKMQSVYAPQYLLDPVPDESRLLDKRWFKYRTPQIDRDLTAKKTYCVIGADPAWLAQSRYGSTRAGAYSVILVFLVDQGYDFYLIDHFREKCAKSRFVQRLFEMSKEHRAVKVGMEVVDLKYLDEAFDLEAHKTKYRPPMEWLSTISSMQKKDDKIIGTLEGFLSQGKIFLYRGMEWLEREAHDFPKSATKDGLDAMVNAVRVARPPKRILDRLGPITDCARDIDELHKRSAAPTDWRKSWAR